MTDNNLLPPDWSDRIGRVEKRLARMVYNQATGVQQDKNGNPLQIGDGFMHTLYPQSRYTVTNFIGDHIVADNGELFHWSAIVKI